MKEFKFRAGQAKRVLAWVGGALVSAALLLTLVFLPSGLTFSDNPASEPSKETAPKETHANYTSAMVFTDSADQSLTDGSTSFTWTAATKTLTVCDFFFTFNISTNTTSASSPFTCMTFPAGTKIILNSASSTGYSQCKLINASTTSFYARGIYCPGDLTITGNGKFNLNAPAEPTNAGYYIVNSTGLQVDGNLTIGDGTDTPKIWSTIYQDHQTTGHLISVMLGGNLTVNSGVFYVSAQTPKGVEAKGIVLNSSTAKIAVNGGGALRVVAAAPAGTATFLSFPNGISADLPSYAYGNTTNASSYPNVLKYDSAAGKYNPLDGSSTPAVIYFSNAVFAQTTAPASDTLYAATATGSSPVAYGTYTASYIENTLISSSSLVFYADAAGAAKASAPDSASQLALSVSDANANTASVHTVTLTLSLFDTTIAGTFYFRFEYNGRSSDMITITINRKAAPVNDAPTGLSLDYQNEAVIGYSSAYEFDSDTAFTAPSASDLSVTGNLSASVPANGNGSASLYVRYKATDQYLARTGYLTLTVPERPAAPSGGTAALTGETKVTISGLTAGTSQYAVYADSLTPTSSSWLNASAATAEVNVALGDKVVIRNKATSSAFASESALLFTVSKTASPFLTGFTSEVTSEHILLKGLAANTTYYVNGDSQHEITTDASGQAEISLTSNSSLLGLTLSGLALKYTSAAQTSDVVSLTPVDLKLKYATPAPSFDSDTSVLSGLSASGTYVLTYAGGTKTLSGASSYTLNSYADLLGQTITSIQLTGDSSKTPAGSYQSSEAVSGLSYQVHVVYEAPQAQVDYAAETLTGLSAGETYTITDAKGQATDAVAGEDGTIKLQESWLGTSSAAQTLQIVHKSLDSAKYVSSASQTLQVGGRPETPAASSLTYKATADGKIEISGVTEAMEYQIGTEPWTAVTGSSLLTEPGTEVKIRIKAVEGQTPSSATLSVTAPAAEATPAAQADLDNGKLTGLTAGQSYLINGTSYQAGTDGTIAIDSSWYGKDLKIIAPGSGAVIDSAAEVLPISTLAAYLKPYAATAVAELKEAGSYDTASEEMKKLIEGYEAKITLASKSYPTAGEAKAEIDRLKEECFQKITFQKAKDDVSTGLDALVRECQGKEKIQTIVDEAKDTLSQKTFENSTVAEVEKIYTDTQEKVTLTLNSEVMPNRLAELQEELGDKYTYPDSSKEEIAQIISQAKKDLTAAATSAEQETIYQKAVEAIEKVPTDEAKTAKQDTSYPDGYDYSKDGLIGTAAGTGFDAQSTLSIAFQVEAGGQSSLDSQSLKEDYYGTVDVSSNEKVSSGSYTISFLLPAGYDKYASYRVYDADGHEMTAALGADGYLTFTSSSLGKFRVGTDYKADTLLYIVIPLFVIIIAEAAYALIMLKKIRAQDKKASGQVKASLVAGPLGLLLATHTVVTLGTIWLIIVEAVLILLLFGLDFCLYRSYKKGQAGVSSDPKKN
jgi:hypothetical protein